MLSIIQIERVLFRKSFLDFIKHAWSQIEGAGEYVHGRHIDVMAAHLQAFGEKRIRKLILNIPPGCSKSNVFMVLYPAWKWTWAQDAGFLCQSYGMKLALRDATACRRLVESEWYQARWPEVKLEDDDNAKAYYRTTRGGFRLSTTANVSVTGQHPTDVLCDDPISVDDGEDKAACDAWVNWFTKTVGSRGAARKVCHSIAQQRVGMLDPSGWAIEQNVTAEREGRKKPWVHVMLPMRYEPERAMEDVGFGGDWRKEKGELLFPQVHTEEIVSQVEYDIGARAAKTQLQHNPQKLVGVLFNVENLQKITDADVPECDIWVRFWDKAGTSDDKNSKKKTKPCNTAGVLLGAKKLAHNSWRYIIRDAVADKWEPHVVEDKITHYAEVDITIVPKSKYVIGVEREGGSGGKFSANETVRRNRDFKVEEERPTENKIKRANPLIVAIGFKEVYIVQAGFTKKLTDELEDVAKYGEDATLMDQFDALAHAVNLANRLLGGKGQKAILSKSNSVSKTRLCVSPGCNRPAADDSDYCCKSCEINASWNDGSVCKEHESHCVERSFQHEQRHG